MTAFGALGHDGPAPRRRRHIRAAQNRGPRSRPSSLSKRIRSHAQNVGGRLLFIGFAVQMEAHHSQAAANNGESE